MLDNQKNSKEKYRCVSYKAGVSFFQTFFYAAIDDSEYSFAYILTDTDKVNNIPVIEFVGNWIKKSCFIWTIFCLGWIEKKSIYFCRNSGALRNLWTDQVTLQVTTTYWRNTWTLWSRKSFPMLGRSLWFLKTRPRDTQAWPSVTSTPPSSWPPSHIVTLSSTCMMTIWQRRP